MNVVIYVVLMTTMFFSDDIYFSVGGMELSLKNPCAIAVIIFALLNFAVTARLDRVVILAKHSLIQMFPYLITLFFSFFIWVISGVELHTIWLGLITLVPQLVAICVAAATLYILGEKGVWYCLGSMCLANLFKAFIVMRQGGFGVFLRQYIRLVVTFSGETGPLMRKLELHDLTFAFGLFLIYLILMRKETRHSILWLAPTVFFFLLGLKRIAVLGVVLGLAVVLLLQFMPEKAARQTALCIAVLMIAGSFLYIVFVEMGFFDYLENVLHINTMGRRRIYQQLKPYYDIRITYMGRGVGFERSDVWLSAGRGLAIHNDFLRMYMNVGFIGYWIWCWSFLVTRLHYWFVQGKKNGGCLFLGICIYCFVLYATDNCLYYPYTSMVCALLPMSYNLNSLTDNFLKRLDARGEGREITF